MHQLAFLNDHQHEIQNNIPEPNSRAVADSFFTSFAAEPELALTAKAGAIAGEFTIFKE